MRDALRGKDQGDKELATRLAAHTAHTPGALTEFLAGRDHRLWVPDWYQVYISTLGAFHAGRFPTAYVRYQSLTQPNIAHCGACMPVRCKALYGWCTHVRLVCGHDVLAFSQTLVLMVDCG